MVINVSLSTQTRAHSEYKLPSSQALMAPTGAHLGTAILTGLGAGTGANQVPTLGVAHSHEYCHISIVDAAVPCKDVVKVSTSSLFVRSVLNTTHLIQTSQIPPLALTSGVERLRACNWGSKPSFNVQLFIVGE